MPYTSGVGVIYVWRKHRRAHSHTRTRTERDHSARLLVVSVEPALQWSGGRGSSITREREASSTLSGIKERVDAQSSAFFG